MKAPNDLKEILKEKGYDAQFTIRYFRDKAGMDARRLYVKTSDLLTSTFDIDGEPLPYPWHMYITGNYLIIYVDYAANDKSYGTYMNLLYDWIKSHVINEK